MEDQKMLEGMVTENEFVEMEGNQRTRMEYRCLCAIFSELKEIRIIIDNYQKTNKYIQIGKGLLLAGTGGVIGALLTMIGEFLSKIIGLK